MSHDYKIIKNQIVNFFKEDLSDFIFGLSDKSLDKLNIKDIISLSNIIFITRFSTNGYNALNLNEFIDVLNNLETNMIYEQKHFIEYSKLTDQILEVIKYAKLKSSFYNDLPKLLDNYHVPLEKKDFIKNYLIDVLDSVYEIEAFCMDIKIQKETIEQLILIM